MLLLAGVAGIVFLLPVSPVHAAGPTVTVSTESSGVLTAITSTTVGTSVVLTGSGFSPAATISITTAVGASTVNWLTNGGCATATGGSSGLDSLVVAHCLTSTASGTFQTTIAVPSLPGGPNTITVSDGTLTGTAILSINTKVSITYTGNNYGYPEESIQPKVSVSGFASGEVVAITTPMWGSTATQCTAGSAIGTFGACNTGTYATVVQDTTQGGKTVTATGQTSGFSGVATYTINPWVAFYNSGYGQTTFSFVDTAPASILVEGHGFPAGTIAPNTVTVGGVATTHVSETIGITGGFGGAGAQLTVSPTSAVPFGPATVVIDGITFSYALGNILSTVNAIPNGGYTSATTNYWGGVLVASVANSATAVVTVDKSSYMPGIGFTASTTSSAPPQNQIGFFGYGFTTAGAAIGIATPAGVTYIAGPAFVTGNTAGGPFCTNNSCDINGAVFAIATLSDTPWSAAATPTTQASYTATVSQQAAVNYLSPSYSITPWISGVTVAGAPSSTVDYTVNTLQFTVHGYSVIETVTATVAGTAMVVGGFCTTGATGTCTNNGAGQPAQVPDLAAGKQTMTVTGGLSTATATTTLTYDPVVNFAAGGSLSVNSGSAGTTVVLRTGTGYGVHGLLASTAYNLVWNAISGGTVLQTFTTTATGGLVVPGVTFTVPADVSGIHILDIQPATGGTALYGGTLAKEVTPNDGFFAAPNNIYTTAFGDLLFNNIALLSSSPSVATINVANTISGTGLASGVLYIGSLCNTELQPACPGTQNGNTAPLDQFTSTSTGSVPSGVTITLSDTPTATETGTVQYWAFQTAANFGTTGAPSAVAKFVLAATASDSVSSGPGGTAVTISAHALNQYAVYDIVFNYVQSPIVATSYTGTIVGVVAPSATGAGTAVWNVPATATPGTYTVTLVVATQGCTPAGAPVAFCGLAVGSQVLDTPLSFTVGGTTGSCTTEGTGCMGVSGTPTVTTSGQNTIVNANFINNSNAGQTAFIYGVVRNSIGQTVYYTTATVSPAAGATATAQLVLFGLAPGSYAVSLFATSTAGTAISTTTIVTVSVA